MKWSKDGGRRHIWTVTERKELEQHGGEQEFEKLEELGKDSKGEDTPYGMNRKMTGNKKWRAVLCQKWLGLNQDLAFKKIIYQCNV